MVLCIVGREIEAIAPFSSSGLTVLAKLYDNVRTETTPTVTEIGVTGNYRCPFTPSAEGDWRLVMYSGSEKHVYHFLVYGSPKTSATYNFLLASGTSEVTLVEIAQTGTYSLSFYIDLDVLESAVEGGTITFRLYNKIDASNYADKPNARIDYVVGSSVVYPSIEAERLGQYSKVTVQCSSAVTTTRAAPYYYIIERRGT